MAFDVPRVRKNFKNDELIESEHSTGQDHVTRYLEAHTSWQNHEFIRSRMISRIEDVFRMP